LMFKKIAGLLAFGVGAFLSAYFIWLIPTIKDPLHFWVALGELTLSLFIAGVGAWLLFSSCVSTG